MAAGGWLGICMPVQAVPGADGVLRPIDEERALNELFAADVEDPQLVHQVLRNRRAASSAK